MFKNIDPRQYACLRILFGILALVDIFGLYPYANFFYSDKGWLSVDTALRASNSAAWSLLYIFTSPFAVKLLLVVALIAALCFTLGFRTRLASFIIFICLGSLAGRNPLGDAGDDAYLIIMFFYLTLCPCGEAWSADSFLKTYKEKLGRVDVNNFHSVVRESLPTVPCAGWPLILIQIQICLVYLDTGLIKLHGVEWLQGSAIRTALSDGILARWNFEALKNNSLYISLTTLGARVTMAWELLFSVLVLNKWGRWVAIVMGVFVHGTILILMQLNLFSQVMIASYFAFVPNQLFAKLENWLKGKLRSAGTSQSVAIFDFDCAFCGRLALLLGMLDITEKVQWIPVQNEKIWRDRAPQLNASLTRDTFHLIIPGGKILTGVDAMENLADNLPCLFLLRLCFVLPGSNKLISWVAAHGIQVSTYLEEFFSS